MRTTSSPTFPERSLEGTSHACRYANVVSVVLLAAVLGLVFTLVIVGLARIWTIEGAFVRLGWIPAAAVPFEIVLFPWLAERISYAAALVPVVTALVSLFVAVIGATLLAVAREHGETKPAVRRVTLVAVAPGVILVGWVLLSLAGIVAGRS